MLSNGRLQILFRFTLQIVVDTSRQMVFVADHNQLTHTSGADARFDAAAQCVHVHDFMVEPTNRNHRPFAEGNRCRQPMKASRNPRGMTLRKVARRRQCAACRHGYDDIASRIADAQRIAARTCHAFQRNAVDGSFMRDVKVVVRNRAGGCVSSEKAQHRE